MSCSAIARQISLIVPANSFILLFNHPSHSKFNFKLHSGAFSSKTDRRIYETENVSH